MIALDTNVLVRILVADDPKQTRKAKALFRQLGKQGSRAYVSDIVLCEIVWVLSHGYGHARDEIVIAVGRLLGARQLQFASSDRVARALVAYRTRKGDLADYLIREHARSEACEAVVTFDKVLHGEEMFRAP